MNNTKYLHLLLVSLSVAPTTLTTTINLGNAICQRVTGGQVVSEGKYPWFARYSIKGAQDALKPGPYGAGMLIDKYWVLTAAHVVMELHGTPGLVGQFTFGLYDLNKPNNSYVSEIDEIFLHPLYSSGADMALVKLKKPVLHIKPISIANHNQIPVIGSMATTIGFGISGVDKNENDIIYPTQMQEAQIPIVNKNWIKENNAEKLFLGIFNDKFDLLAGSTSGVRQAAALGDSGGPLIQNIDGQETLIGVVKSGPYEWTKPSPTCFSSVYKQYSWINEIIKK